MNGQRQGSIAWTVLIALGSLALIGWMVFDARGFGATTKAHGPLMAFLKFFALGTLGTIIKTAKNTGRAAIAHGFEQSVVWGSFGIWIGAAIVVFSIGVEGAIKAGWWFNVSGFLLALSKSFWINLAGGYAFSMMVTHQYTDRLIMKRWHGLLAFTDFADSVDPRKTVAYIWKTIWLFWLPAHTITFMLPPEYRVFMAAGLSVALGFLLAMTSKSSQPALNRTIEGRLY